VIRLRTGVVLAALVALVAPSIATAAGGVDVKLNQTARWPDRELVLSLPSKRVVTNEQVTLLENGRSVQGIQTAPASTSPNRGVILAIDASLTMQGEPIRQAMIAARSFAKRRSETTPLGIVFFSREPRLALAPTTDAQKIKTTLAVGPALTRGTKIFDAAATGIKALRDAGLTSGAIVVLSDGAEAQRGSAVTPVALAQDARKASVRIFSVGLSSRSFDDTSLRTMADGTGGRYGEAASPRDLPPLFAAIGERLSSEYLVTYRSTAPAGQQVRVGTRVDGFAGTTALTYRAPSISFADTGNSLANESSGLDRDRIMLIAIGGFLVMTLVLFLVLQPKQRSLVARVSDFASPGSIHAPTMADVKVKKAREPSDRWKRFADSVELADVRVTPLALVLWTAAGTAVVAWYFGFAVDRPALMIVALGIPLAARAHVKRKLAKRQRDFEDQLPDNLQVLASALRAGYSFSAALASMAEDAAEPSKTELRRASTDEQLGVDVADALQAVGERMASQELEYVGIVARMQRDVGGNTAEILDQVIETIRARHQLKRMVRALTAQGRLGGTIISGLPPLVGMAMAVLNPGYFDPMFESAVGYFLVAIAATMIFCGWLIIRKIVDVEP